MLEVSVRIASHFTQVARAIRVKDVASPIFKRIEADKLVEDVVFEWFEECTELEIDPFDQLALVTEQGYIGGWVTYDMLEAGKKVGECCEPLYAQAIVTADTPLSDIAESFRRTWPHFYFVLERNRYIGWVTYSDLQKLPFRLCLLARFFGLEQMLTDFLKTHAQEAVNVLPATERTKVTKLCEAKYPPGEKKRVDDGTWPASKLIDCLSFGQKMKLLQASKWATSQVKSLKNKYADKILRIRNDIAHPGPQANTVLLDRNDFDRFLSFVDNMERELAKALGAAKRVM